MAEANIMMASPKEPTKKVAKREGVLNITAEYTVTVIGKDGKIKQVVKGESKSLVRNALRYLYGQLSAQSVTLKDTSNGSVTASFDSISSPISGFKWCYGVGCGTDNTAWSIDQYELIGKYGDIYSLSLTAYIESDSTGYWDITGGIPITSTVTIKEICLYGRVNGSQKVMVARDVLGTPVSCVDGDTLAVTYTPKTKAS
jgi:hypothetical protein